MRNRAVLIALVAALPLVLLTAWSSSQMLPRFSDPCYQWGDSQPMTRVISPDSPCQSVEGTSQTKFEATLQLFLINGGILIAGALGILGVSLGKPAPTVFGAGLMFLESVPLIFSFAWLTVFVSGMLLLAARATAPLHGAAKFGARLLGSLAALAAVVYVPGLLYGAPLFLIFLLIALAFVAATGWWPIRPLGSWGMGNGPHVSA